MLLESSQAIDPPHRTYQSSVSIRVLGIRMAMTLHHEGADYQQHSEGSRRMSLAHSKKRNQGSQRGYFEKSFCTQTLSRKGKRKYTILNNRLQYLDQYDWRKSHDHIYIAQSEEAILHHLPDNCYDSIARVTLIRGFLRPFVGKL